MRIGFDGKRATQNFRGLGNYSRGLIEGLHQYTNENLFLYTPSSAYDPRAEKWLSDLNQKVEIRTPKSLVGKCFPSFWRSSFMTNDLKMDHLDIYHGLSHEIPFGANQLGLKSVVTIHDLIFMRYPEFFPWIDRQTYLAKFKYSTKNADMVIAICEQTKKDLIELLSVDEKKIVVHYQSCDPIFYSIAEPKEINLIKEQYGLKKPYILNVGAFEERKNQKNLIKAFAQSSRHIEHDLVLVGSGKVYLEECKELARNLNIIDRVYFLSDVTFKSLPLLYQGADLFCFPSFYEGFGIPIVEALYSKVPVITSKGSCFPESAGPYSEYIDPNSVSDIAERICWVLKSEEHKSKMIHKSYEFVQKFHRKHSTDALVKHYHQLLNQ